MNTKKVAAASYLVMAMACFGPATVDAQKDGDAEVAECKAAMANDGTCSFRDDFVPVKGLLQAAVWPLWLSYKIAYSIDEG